MKKVMHRARDQFYSEDFEFFIDRRSLSPGALHEGLHWHDYCEVEFICSGRGDHYLNNVYHEISPGSVYMLTPMDFHSVNAKAGEELVLYHIQFGSSTLGSSLMQRISQDREQLGRGFSVQLTGHEADSIRTDFEQLLAEFDERNSDGVMMMRACLERLCIRILRMMESDAPSAPTPAPVNENAAVKSAIQYVQYNFRSPITLNEMAKMVHLSCNYFGELFRTHMGVSFGEYLRSRRLECAHRLLADTELSISEIARESGFRTMSHFSETFRRRYGVTPTEFRRGERAESEE